MHTSTIRAFFLLVILGILVLLAVFGVMVTDERGDHIVTRDVYSGQYQSDKGRYTVWITQTDVGYGVSTVVQVMPFGVPGHSGIMGEDNDNDGTWDRVLYCGNHEFIGRAPQGEFGCNAVRRTSVGWVFEPCPEDTGLVQPFTEQAIAVAIGELNAAFRATLNVASLHERYIWEPVERAEVRIFNRAAEAN